MTVLEAHEDRNVVDVDITLEDNLMELVAELDSSMLANAILEAAKMGVYLPMTRKSTVQDIASMIVDGFEEVAQYDIASYWAHNFRIVGVL